MKADFVLVPELLERDEYSMRAAGWFWFANKCGRFGADVAAVTKVINGGLNGIDDRKARVGDDDAGISPGKLSFLIDHTHTIHERNLSFV